MVTIKTKVKADFSGFATLKQKLIDLSSTSVDVGFWSEVEHPNGKLDSASLANILHNGARKGQIGEIPARPFLRDGMLDGEADIRRTSVRQYQKFMSTRNKRRFASFTKPLEDVGRGWVKQRILFNTYEENASSTVRRKSFNRPLYETGWLANNVQTKVRKKRA